MAQTKTEAYALPSLLDRLVDEDPKRESEPLPSRAQSVRIFKEALRRDLEWLLNTRAIPEMPPEEMEDLHASLYCYGLPDLSSFNLVSPSGRGRIQRAMQHVVEAFEPRLTNVQVIPAEAQTPSSRVVSFVISGLLRMEPAPEQISFDTVLELARGEYRVRGIS